MNFEQHADVLRDVLYSSACFISISKAVERDYVAMSDWNGNMVIKAVKYNN